MKILLPIFLILISAGVYLGYIDGAFDKVKVLQAEEKEYETALKRSEDLNAIHDRLLGTYNSINSGDLDRLQKLLPDNIDSIRLLIDIDGIAAENGLTLSGLGADVDQPAEGRGEIGTVTVNFSTIAPYATFKSFLRDLESSLRIIDVTALSFNSRADDGQGQPDTDLFFDVSFDTYWMN